MTVGIEDIPNDTQGLLDDHHLHVCAVDVLRDWLEAVSSNLDEVSSTVQCPRNLALGAGNRSGRE